MTRNIWIVLAATMLAACGSKEPTSVGGVDGEATSGGEYADGGRCVATETNHEISEYDTSGDNKSDVRKLFSSVGEGRLARLVLICREADLNGDGSKDVVRFYTDEGRPKREEADRDFDGSIDEITHFSKGRIALQEIDQSDNGRIDTKIYYERGQPIRAERDVAGRSTAGKWQADRWEYYEDGRTVRVGTDVDGDGKVDRWDRDAERLRQKNVLAQEEGGDSSSQ